VLAALVEGRLPPQWRRGISGLWLGLGVLVLTGAMLSPLLPSLAALRPMAGLALPGGLGLLIAGWRLGSERGSISGRGAAAWALVLGWGLSLLLLFSTPLWNWELNERPSILPLLPLLPQPGSGSAELPLAITGPIAKRPSLWWYAQNKPRGESWIGREDRPALLVITDRSEFQADRPFRFTSGRSSVQLQCQLNQKGQDGWNRWLCSATDRHRSAASQSS
jgi:hypothetical protein